MSIRLLLSQVLMLCISAHDLHYVNVNNSSADVCPVRPCFTLGQLADMTDRYFTAGSTFLFLSGNHSLQAMISLTNVSDIILRSWENGNSSSAIVYLVKNAAIVCNNVSNFHIEGLTFILCKYHCKVGGSALQFMNSAQIMISYSTFQGSGNHTQATVMSVYAQRSNVTILECLFEGNTAGALLAQHRSAITITGSTFIRNKAMDSNGASVSILGGIIIFEPIFSLTTVVPVVGLWSVNSAHSK